MIDKKKEDYLFHEDKGRPFEMNERGPIEKNDAERQTPKVINLEDLNRDRAPRNFLRKAGRTISSFENYWTKDKETPDIQ